MCEVTPRFEARLFVLLVTALIILSALITLHTIAHDPVLTRSKLPPSQFHQYLYTSTIILSLVCYLRAHFTHPGKSEKWTLYRPDLIQPYAVSVPDLEDQSAHICSRCNKPKQRRVHHCSYCRQCILRFDHHCPWVGTCIGLLNAKYFLQFLLYTAIASLYTLLLQFRFLLHCRKIPVKAEHILLVAFASPLTLAISSAAFCATASLLTWNLRLTIYNETALENFRRANGHSVTNYDQGIWHNLKHILGYNWWFWPLPIAQRFGPVPNCKS